jgi:uncharacterized protein YbjQ (UPF0145 family)
MSDNISVVTSNYVPGYKISEIKGLIWGLTIRSRGLGGNIVAGLRAIGGGEIKEYVTLLNKARDDALDRLKAEASKLGANAVIDVRFDSSDIAQSMTEIVAYGTAVIIEKESGKIQPVSLR